MLINCPNCGKQISDKAKECIHCKYALNTEAPIYNEGVEDDSASGRDYKKMSKEERKLLLCEFGTEDVKSYSIIKSYSLKMKIFSILLYPFAIVAIIFAILGFMNVIDYIIGYIVCITGVLLVFVDALFRKKYTHKKDVAYENYAKWLNNKGVSNFLEVLASEGDGISITIEEKGE